MENLLKEAEAIMAKIELNEHKECIEELISMMKKNDEPEELMFEMIWISGWIHGLNFAAKAMLER